MSKHASRLSDHPKSFSVAEMLKNATRYISQVGHDLQQSKASGDFPTISTPGDLFRMLHWPFLQLPLYVPSLCEHQRRLDDARYSIH